MCLNYSKKFMNLKLKAQQIVDMDISKGQKVMLLCELAREIPYEVLKDFSPAALFKHEKGSCTPKHLFLAECLQAIDVPIKYIVIKHYFHKALIDFPSAFKDQIRVLPLCNHTALKVKLQGSWYILDITWDSALKGFPTNENWNGSSDMLLAVNPEGILEVSRESLSSPLSIYTEQEQIKIREFILFLNEFCQKQRQ